MDRDNIFDIESEMLNDVEDDFNEEIIRRGKDYYYSRKIITLYKYNNKYYAKVKGNNIYNVEIKIDKYYNIDYNCTCPCNFPCKHEYAVFMAISNKEYERIKLKPEIIKKTSTLTNIIQKVPAEELKQFILSNNILDNINIDNNILENTFIKYLPLQEYNYYYNNLYNSIVLDNNPYNYIDNYLKEIDKYISNNNYTESFKIIKSIIESYNDTNKLDTITEYILKLNIFIRIIYRKSKTNTKKEINNYLKHLKNKKYYNNLYLEDIVLEIEK